MPANELSGTEAPASEPASEPAFEPQDAPQRHGRNAIAVIGIDRYQHESWQPLTNAVADARGTAELLGKLGFEQVAALFDDQATSEAVEALVTDDLTRLGPEDSLVLFFAGHGSTRSHQLGSEVVKTGYLIPFDASDRTSTWVELDSWLRAVSLLPAKHILVILDACYSGIALGAVIKWRGGAAQPELPLSALRARRSRRIITSALDNEVALDSGPRRGHSLFTGCLLEALTRGVGHPGSLVITGSELGLYLQDRVSKYPRARQTPDFGTFEFDDRGEMVIPFVMASEVSDPDPDPDPDYDSTPADDQDTGKSGGKPAIDPIPIDPKADGVGWRRWLRRRGGLAGAAGGALALALVLVLVLSASRTCDRDTGPRAIAELRGAPGGAPLGAPLDAPPDAPSDASPGAPSIAEPALPLVASDGCPVGMVRVRAGTFQMGSPAGQGAPSEQPQHAVTLSAYCIDRTEVTVREYRACMAAESCSPTPNKVHLRLMTPYEAPKSMECNGADRPDHPINCVRWDQAAAYCAWAQKRLPTEAEWEYAARGDDGRTYPWGNQSPNADRLNACGRECVSMAERTLQLDWRGMYNDDDGWPTTAPVGRYRRGASPFGALDMAGNVQEWTADAYADYKKEAATNPRYTYEGVNRVFRGGGWSHSDASGVRATGRDRAPPRQAFVDLGFRCVRGE